TRGCAPTHAREKPRQRNEPPIALTGKTDEFGSRELGDVELAAADHAVEDVAAGFKRDAVKFDTFRPDDALTDRLHAIVAAAGETQSQAGHCAGSTGTGLRY